VKWWGSDRSFSEEKQETESISAREGKKSGESRDGTNNANTQRPGGGQGTIPRKPWG